MTTPIDQLEQDFAASDRGGDYFTKLTDLNNKVKELVTGVNAQFAAGEDAATILEAIEALEAEIAIIRDETTAISTGSLNWQARTSDTEVATGQKLLLETPGMQALLNTFKTTIAKGQWVGLKNTSTGNVFLAGIAGITIQGKTGSIVAGNRLIIRPGSTRVLAVINLTTIEVR